MLRLVMRQQMISVVGGATDSIFPEVEALLQSSSDLQRALKEIADKRRMGKYESVMDFLFCELFPEWRASCWRYYVSREHPLRERITSAERLVFAWGMCRALDIAYQSFSEKRQMSWTAFRQEVQLALAG